MRLYEYDSQGFLVGWHEDANRPSSTTISPVGILGSRAKWNGAAWVEDTSRESQQAADAAAEQTKLQQAIAVCKAYDPATATAAEVRATLGASLFLLRRIMRELQ
jgi:hypothetical protein